MHRESSIALCVIAGGALALAACNSDNKLGPAGPDNPGTPAAHQLGDAVAGKEVFLFETFGYEGFWTDAVKLPAGMVAKGVRPVKDTNGDGVLDASQHIRAADRPRALSMRPLPTVLAKGVGLTVDGI